MSDNKSIFIIVPCYNEATVIRATIHALVQKGYSIVVVDDGSDDNTHDSLRGLPVHYIRHAVNLGQGAALNTGIRYALSAGAEKLVTFDADGQHDTGDVEKMISLLDAKGVGIVFGSRFLEGSSTNISGNRKLVLKIGRFINYLVSGILLTDANNGIRALTKDAAIKLQITENRSSHSAQIQNLVKINRIKYTECAVRVSYSAYSKQKGLKSINSIRILYDLILYKIFR